jgi:hypothetical protein
MVVIVLPPCWLSLFLWNFGAVGADATLKVAPSLFTIAQKAQLFVARKKRTNARTRRWHAAPLLAALWGKANQEAMKLRRCTVEHPFAAIKYRIFGHPRLLMRGLTGARAEIGIATMAYNLKRITNVLGAAKLTKELLHAR